ncbi:glycosyltransferase family 2 protein [Robertkochia flava]|uniref:glycosyltransferase family 2 protein n=1 Tax=Robertkochia flava TaxID=3447986 RepID=UPI001CCCF09F|nr:glycosyltransferase family 2 protein [Robertkochia marina]
MNKIKLSVTLAAFNVQDFIQESIGSILNQTFKDFELICIDDASDDLTSQVLKEYAEDDNRIKLILKKENQGLAVARNESLELATGKYILFLDGDDIYDNTLFEKAVHLAERERSDMVLWDYVTFYKKEEIFNLKTIPSDLLKLDASNKVALLNRPAFTWVKLLRTEKLRELKIDFPKGLTRQDIPVHWRLITELEKISILPERLSFYRQQPGATTAKKDSKLFDLVYIMDIVEGKLKDQGNFSKYKREFYTQQLNFFHGMFDNIKDDYKQKALVLIKERLSTDHLKFLKSTKLVRPQTKYFLESISGKPFASLQYASWKFARKIYRTINSNL